MFILSVIPFTKIPYPAPQILDYFSGKKVSPGGIVRVSLGTRKILGVVVARTAVKLQKQQIKKSHFLLKPIEEVLNSEAVISGTVLRTALWASEYFYAPLGLIAKTLVPRVFSKPTKKFLKELTKRKMPKRDDTGQIAPARKPILFNARHNEQAKIIFYRRAIQKTLKNKKSVLFLVPELYKIKYFQAKIPELQNSSCVIGARSALSFLPPNLGLIIVDEEESPFYKSFDQQPYIHAKDVALKLAHHTGAQIILETDYPSLESLWKTKMDEYQLERSLPRGDIQTGQKVHGQVIDLRQELKSGNYSILSRELQTQLRDVLIKNQQAILFINRKGLATGLLCRDCGYVIKCPNCDVTMVYHQTYAPYPMPHTLICHHCGQKQKPQTLCPNCKGTRIKFIGTGTQKVEHELHRICQTITIVPNQCKIARLDTDIAPKWILQKAIFDDFTAKKYNILIGTQLMLKPEMLPKVSLAAIITIDPLFSIPDFRMTEQIPRIIDKLKSTTLSDMIIQTYTPDNYIIQHVLSTLFKTPDTKVNIRNKFLANELENRRVLSFPPFSQLIKLSYTHTNPQKAEEEAKILKNKLQTQVANLALQAADFQLLGPAPAFIPKVKNRYIWQIMIKSKVLDLKMRNQVLRVIPSDWKIDVDPVEML